jgi:galactokinase
MAVALALAEDTLDTAGACRVHGGGFAGTIQVFLPKDLCQSFVPAMECLTGEGSCHLLSFREAGTGCVIS